MGICWGLVQKRGIELIYTHSYSVIWSFNTMSWAGACPVPSSFHPFLLPSVCLDFLEETPLFRLEAFQKFNCPLQDPNLVTLFVWNWQSDLNYSMLFKNVKQLKMCFVFKDVQTLALQAEFPILSHLCNNLRGAWSNQAGHRAGKCWEGQRPWLSLGGGQAQPGWFQWGRSCPAVRPDLL